MAKGRKVKSHPKPLVSDSDSDSCDESIFKGLSKNVMSKLKELMETIEGQENPEKQEDLLILEKERNLELEELLAKEKEKVEKLTKELNLANSSIASLENNNSMVQEKLSSLDESHKTL
jgi:small-conductance mechanosensitive channel